MADLTDREWNLIDHELGARHDTHTCELCAQERTIWALERDVAELREQLMHTRAELMSDLDAWMHT